MDINARRGTTTWKVCTISTACSSESGKEYWHQDDDIAASNHDFTSDMEICDRPGTIPSPTIIHFDDAIALSIQIRLHLCPLLDNSLCRR